MRTFAPRIAVYWPDEPPRLYWDEEYARTTKWGGIIAPQEFNPFAWPPERPGVCSVSGFLPHVGSTVSVTDVGSPHHPVKMVSQ